MTLKEEILKNSGLKNMLTEMAAKELSQVVSLIKSGDIEGAAKKYQEVGGNPSGVTRTVNTYLKNNPKENEENFKKFSLYFADMKKKEGASKPTREYKKTKTGVTKEGEAIEAGGQSAEARNKRLMKRMNTEVDMIKKELSIIKDGTLEQQQGLAQEVLKSFASEELDDEDKKDIEVLKSFIEDGRNNIKAKNIMKEIVEKGAINIASLGDVAAQYRKIKPKEEDIPRLEKRYKKIELIKKKNQEKQNG